MECPCALNVAVRTVIHRAAERDTLARMSAPPTCTPARTGSLPAWVPCDDCEEFVCVIHGGHVAECACPPVEKWSCDPYTEGGNG